MNDQRSSKDRYRDRTGEKEGRLTYISLSHTESKRSYWNVRCDCGTEFVVRACSSAISCGCIRAELNVTRRLDKHFGDVNNETVKLAAARLVYKWYKDTDLTFEEFLNLVSQSCFYCNSPPSNKRHIGLRQDGSLRATRKRIYKSGIIKQNEHWAREFTEGYFVYNGLDRMDNSLDHRKSNVVPCCSTCNYMKRASNKDQFLTKIREIYEHQNK